MKIMIGCNLLSSVDSVAYTNHMKFWYRLGKDMPEHEFMFSAPPRVSIDNMRNMTAKAALEWGADYLFFYDDDVLLPHDALKRLLEDMEANDISAGLVYVRGYPFKPMSFEYKDGNLDHTSDEDLASAAKYGIKIEVDAIGFSCALIDMDVIEKMEPPYFMTGPNHTEDVYFCLKAKAIEEELVICLNTAVQPTHLVGKYGINHQNRKQVMLLEETAHGASQQSTNKGDFEPSFIEKSREELTRR